MSRAAELFARHLDLKPLRGRSRGVVRCRFHQDRTASLSVDLDAGVFNCFGCGEHGGVRRFAELVGEHDPAPRLHRAETPLQEARRRAVQQARRQAERAAEWEPLFFVADFLRRSFRVVDEVRAAATILGSEHPRVWPALDRVAQLECLARFAESELDTMFASGRVA